MNDKISVIFDMDGVLIDSQPLHYEIDLAVLARCGYAADLATVTPHTGTSNPDRWPKYKAQLNLAPEADQLIRWQVEICMEMFRQADLTAIDGIPELLLWLKAQGVKTAVASSSAHELIALVLDKLRIAEFFDVLVSGEDVSAGKPAPDVFLFAAERLSQSPDKCLVIEDSLNGIQAAKNAAMRCIMYRGGAELPLDIFRNQGVTPPDYIIDNYGQCYTILNSMLRG